MKEVLDQLEHGIARTVASWDRASENQPFMVKRLAAPLPEVDPLRWLYQQPFSRRFYWQGREDNWELAGVGVADEVMGSPDSHPDALIDRCRALMQENPGLRYIGGFCFDPSNTSKDDVWASWGSSHFWLPRFEVMKTEGQAMLVCNLVFQREMSFDHDALINELHQLVWEEALTLPKTFPAGERVDRPDHVAWADAVSSTMDCLQHGVLDKLVLAREVEVTCSSVPDPVALLLRVRDRSRYGYYFCLQPERDHAFLAATPERLFKRKDRKVWSEAVAGTRPRDPNPVEDDRLSQALLTSKKDLLEHEIVRRSIRQRLHLLCDSLDVPDEVHLLRLDERQHLFSAALGKIKPGVSDGAIVAGLHPTPAVGGYPTDVALSELSRLEPFDRGWYAAPVGWISRDAAEFCVGIRSARVAGSKVFLYSGAGIVAGSQPELEWEEIENKISEYLSVLANEDV